MFDVNNPPAMITLEYDHFLKVIVLQIDDFESTIIDEHNFSLNDKSRILKFKQPYLRRDDCHIVEIEM